MKKLAIIGLLAFSFGSCTRTINQTSVPSDVKTAFNQKYPEATDMKWYEEDDNYAVRFYEGRIRKEAEYRPDGRLVNVKDHPTNMDEVRAWIRGDFNPPDVPSEVMSTFNSEFPEASETVWQEVHDDYKATFKHGDTEKEATFSSTGELLDVEETTGAIEDVDAWVSGEYNQPDVPEKVMSTFEEEFPDADDVVWQEVHNDYKATFKHEDIEKEATFSSAGELLDSGETSGTKEEVGDWVRGEHNQPDVPEEVMSTFEEEFPDANDVVWQGVHDDYKATFMHEDTEKEAFFSPSGELLQVDETTGAFEDVEDWVRGEDEGEGQIEESEVPEEVIDAFNNRHPDASDVEWQEAEGNYEVSFSEGQARHEAVYREDGHLLKTGKSDKASKEARERVEGAGIEEEEVPDKVKSSFENAFPDANNTEWEKKDGDYTVRFEQGKKKKEAIYRSNGTLRMVRDKKGSKSENK